MSTDQLFGRGAAAFYRGLAADNSREYFEAHREEYQRAIRVPLEDLVDFAQERYGPGKVFRPNRDTRFSKDKSPYKLGGALWAGRVGGVYAQISADGVWAGGGLYEPSRDQLARAREAITASRGRAAGGLRAAIDAAASGGLEFVGSPLRTAPRGFDRDHPQIELLRMQRYAAMKRLPLKATRHDVVAAWEAVEPLLAWIERYAGPATGR